MGTDTISHTEGTGVLSRVVAEAIDRASIPQVLKIASIFVLVIISMFQIRAVGAQTTSEHTPGIRTSQQARLKLNQDRLRRITARLEDLTGLSGIRFDNEGTLRLDDAKLDQFGSRTAREIINKVIETVRVTLEDYSRSMDVAFAKIKPGVVYLFPNGKKVPTYTLMVDFQDFEHLGGDEDALKAFDLGFVVLHELVHAVENKRDPVGRDGVYEEGDCEEMVNLVRQELGLPVRLNYRSERVGLGPSPHLRFERLKFARLKPDSELEEEIYYVQWPTSFVTK
jgi:hypothetical protein